MHFTKIILFALLIFDYERNFCAESARILGIFPLAGKSLNLLYNRLMKGLADVGHDVIVISAHKNKLPISNGTYTDVLLTGFAEDYEELLEMIDLFATKESYSIDESNLLFELFLPMYNKTMRHPNFLKFIRQNNKFDLVISEYMWGIAPMALASYYNCPLALFTSLGGVNVWINDMVGNPMPVSYVPHYYMLGDYSNGMNIFQRGRNLLYYLYDHYHNKYIHFPAHDEIIKFLLPNGPTSAEIYNSPSLLLLGSHSSLRPATTFTPNVVEIGGFHIDPPKKLPKDLQDFLDNAKDGVIYFSMGSHLKSKNISPEKKNIILNVFKKLRIKILWKFEDELLPGSPDNILIKKWLPQMDILGHPNVKLFIGHGGYGSILETVYHGVPTLLIPVFADQYNNAFQAESRGFALKLSYSDSNFTEDNFYRLVKELWDNPKYTERAKYISQLFHDRPMKPLETAIYWIEYVIRHRGADHLKVARIKLAWYEFYMIDVLLIVIVTAFAIIYSLIGLFKFIFCKKSKTAKAKLH